MPSHGLTRALFVFACSLFGSQLVAQTDWFDVSPAPSTADSLLAFDPVNGGLLGFDGTDTWLFRGGRWTRFPSSVRLPSRYRSAMAGDSNRSRLVLFGGSQFIWPGRVIYLDETWEWNGVAWVQAFPATRPAARHFASLAFDSIRGETVLFGGGATGSFNDTWLWNGTQWRQASPLASPPPRAGATIAFDPLNGITLLYGGIDSTGAVLDDTWAWTGTAWINLGAGPPARHGAKMAFDAARGQVVLFGGSTLTSRGAYADTWAWTSSGWTQHPVAGPPARDGHGLAFDPTRNSVVCHGGYANNAFWNSDTWEWNGTRWIDLGTDSIPGPTLNGAMAFDSRRRVAVFFGGGGGAFGGAFSNFSFAWDGFIWRQLAASASPPGRWLAGLAYDQRRDRMVMFGGESNATLFDDTWEFDGTQWLQRTAPRSPLGRFAPCLVYDSARGRTVLFGGGAHSTINGPLVDTWEWDGTTWHLMMQGFPSARMGHAMAFDARRRVTLMFGGQDVNGPLDETWRWNGSRWRRLTPATVPPARSGHVLVYDSLRERVVLFGGRDAGNALLTDTWEWNGIDWSRVVTPHSPDPVDFILGCYDDARHRLVCYRVHSAQVMEYGTLAIPRVESFGHACPGSAGMPHLAAEHGAMPWVGEIFTVAIESVAAGAPAFVALGFSNLVWGSTPLPLDLAPLQMPGCELFVSPDSLLGPVSGGPTAALPIPIPSLPALIGASLYAQAFAFDAAANPAGLIASDALALRLGAR